MAKYAPIPEQWLDELRFRVQIVDVVQEYVQLRQSGRRYTGLCPFHTEKTPSFSVDPDSQLFYCFGCHKGGNVIHFVMELEHLEFLEAVEMLAQRANMAMPERSSAPRDAGAAKLREQIYEANKLAARYYHDLLFTPEGGEALTYLYKRGLDDNTIKRFGLGASGHEWDGLTKRLTGQGIPLEVLVAAGLTVKREQSQFDMFRSRVMFPIIHPQGKVVGFGGRILGTGNPKYLNTSDTPVFNKRNGLYALHMAKKERSLEKLILVEGYMDVVALMQQGLTGVVATLGTALTDDQARLAKRYAKEVWVCYDGDSAGQKATMRALDILEAQGIGARVVAIPDGKDPDEFVRAHGLRGFEGLGAMPAVAYRMLRAQDGLDMAVEEQRLQYAMAACEILKMVQNPVEQDSYLKRLSVQTGIDVSVLMAQMGEAPRQAAGRTAANRPPRRREVVLTPSQRAQHLLLAMIGKQALPKDTVTMDDFPDPLAAQIAGHLLSGTKPMAVLDLLEEENRALAAQILGQELLIREDSALKSAEELVMQIRIEKLDERIAQTKQELAAAQGDIRRALVERIQRYTIQKDQMKRAGERSGLFE